MNTAITFTLNFNLLNGGLSRKLGTAAKIQEIAGLSFDDQLLGANSLLAQAYDNFLIQASIYELNVKGTDNAETALKIAKQIHRRRY